jgi:hypothetical protein
MRLESKILVCRTPERIWAFLGDPANVPKWDRGVSEVVAKDGSGNGGSASQDAGVEFDTLADPSTRGLKDRGRMSYRVEDVDPAGYCTVRLTSTEGNARFFKDAEWRFHVEAAPEGAWVHCAAVFTLRWQYLFMAPVLYAARKAILIDLKLLKGAIEVQ